MRRRLLVSPNEGIKASEAMAFDICLYNKTTDKLLIVKSDDFSVSNYPSSTYSPVGIVVVPGTHDVYGTGECGVMSIVPMSCETPATGGTSEQSMYWGQYDTDISTITNYDTVCYVYHSTDNTIYSTVQGTTSYAYLPSDNFSEKQNPYDDDTYYINMGGMCYAPSPYNNDESRNPAYYQTSSPSSSTNTLSDFDGAGNTDKIIKLATSQSSWKTDSTITDSSEDGYSPAACCCWRYHTDGTSQGDWYLPAMGELGYIMPKLKKFIETIKTLKSAYGVGVLLGSSLDYWSSSVYSNNYEKFAWYMNTNSGIVVYALRKYMKNVRAFLRVK